MGRRCDCRGVQGHRGEKGCTGSPWGDVTGVPWGDVIVEVYRGTVGRCDCRGVQRHRGEEM